MLIPITQGAALGYFLVGLSGRLQAYELQIVHPHRSKFFNRTGWNFLGVKINFLCVIINFHRVKINFHRVKSSYLHVMPHYLFSISRFFYFFSFSAGAGVGAGVGAGRVLVSCRYNMLKMNMGATGAGPAA